jgi:hypothetical protein
LLQSYLAKHALRKLSFFKWQEEARMSDQDKKKRLNSKLVNGASSLVNDVMSMLDRLKPTLLSLRDSDWN